MHSVRVGLVPAASPAGAGVAFAVLLWSGNFIVGRAMRTALSPLSINFWRWTIALAVLLPFAWPHIRRHWPSIAKHWKLIALLGVTGIACFQTIVYVALTETSAFSAMLLLSLAPIAIAVFSHWLLGEGMTPMKRAGIGASTLGAAVLVAHGSAEALMSLRLGAGELWMVLAVALWTIYSLLVKRLPRELPQSAVLASAAVVGVIVMLPVYLSLPSRENLLALPGPAQTGLLYIGLLASAPPFILWNRGVAAMGASHAGVFLNLMPLFGAVMGFVFLGEQLQAYQVFGAAFIFAGIAAMARG
jgi:drug/metabolite transporter (DMT)-like permease